MNLIVEREKSVQALEDRIATLRGRGGAAANEEVRVLEAKYAELQQDLFGRLTPWERVNMARHPKRPIASDYIATFDQFDELHGDRHFRDDPAIIAGFAKLRGRRVIAIAQEKGRDVKEKVYRNFGMATPEGYRKVKRRVELAGRLRLPIVTFIDTSGADPGIGSEERAQSEAIAASLFTLASVPVPVVATIIGEGGSGGALALALADRVMMLEHSVYSVASPEGAAAILWGDASKADEAASRLRLTSDDLLRFGIVDEVIPEPLGGAHRETAETISRVMGAVDAALGNLATVAVPHLLDQRYAKFRRIGNA
jgi:acetyl-CoA carboxylase carboxyl transferase subunit alpha